MQAAIGKAWSQSPLWGEAAARNLTRSSLFPNPTSTIARSCKTSGLSQNDCLDKSESVGIEQPNDEDHDCKLVSKNESVGQGMRAKMESWREEVLAAEAKKAGSASDAALLIPSPPSLTGKLACSH